MIFNMFKSKTEKDKAASVKLQASVIKAKLDACLYRQSILEQELKNNTDKIKQLKKDLKEADNGY